MKKLNAFLMSVLTTAALNAAVIEQVIVRQQWPWSTDVKVEYKLSGVTSPVDINVTALNGEVPLDDTRLQSSITGDLFAIATDGVGSFTIDPVKAFGTASVALANFKVKLTLSASDPRANEVLYKIVQLDSPYKVSNVTRKDILSGRMGTFETKFENLDPAFSTPLEDVVIWTGVTNDIAYKTTSMVFRRIPAGDASYLFQEGVKTVNDGEGLPVSFSKDFYLAVFPMTQAQALKLNSTLTFFFTNEQFAATRPADKMGYNYRVRGATDGQRWPEGDHTTIDAKNGYTDLVIYQMQEKTGLLVDLPTETMWEFACRGGVRGNVLYSGQTGDAAAAKLLVSKLINNGAASTNQNADDTEGTRPVGSFLPNAYGLYDMLGNIEEWCLEVYTSEANLKTLGEGVCYGKDPRGSTETSGTGTYRITRGCSYQYAWTPTVTARSGNAAPAQNWTQFGLRLAIYLDKNDDGTK